MTEVKKKVAIGIPTYQRPCVIEELLREKSDIYFELGIDIYIYDSSEDELTQNIVEEYMKKYSFINYIHVDSSVPSNAKVYSFFEEFCDGDYEYLWICADYVRWGNEILKKVIRELDNGYAAIVMGYYQAELIGDKVYHDAVELLMECSWVLTLYGATIINVNKILTDIDWNYYKDKYYVPERLNFSHVGLYFEQFAKTENLSVKHIYVPRLEYIYSSLKGNSGWYRNAIITWGKCWPSVINALPNIYVDVKEEAIKNFRASYLFSREWLLRYRKENYYNLCTFIRFLFQWKRFLDYSYSDLFLLAIIPRRFCINANMKLLIRRSSIKKCINKYKKFYMYGCGKKAEKMLLDLTKRQRKYLVGFLVTTMDSCDKCFNGYSVSVFDEALLNSDVGIIMAVNRDNYIDIVKTHPGILTACNIFDDFEHAGYYVLG